MESYAKTQEGLEELRILSNRIRQLENELRYCLVLIETNIDCSAELRVEYAKSLLTKHEVHS